MALLGNASVLAYLLLIVSHGVSSTPSPTNFPTEIGYSDSFGNFVYYLYNGQYSLLSFTEARAFCKDTYGSSADLASVTSRFEYDFIHQMRINSRRSSNRDNGDFWLGIQSRRQTVFPEEFYFLDGSTQVDFIHETRGVLPWSARGDPEPDAEGLCISWGSFDLFDDRDCQGNHGWLCKVPLHSFSPTTYIQSSPTSSPIGLFQIAANISMIGGDTFYLLPYAVIQPNAHEICQSMSNGGQVGSLARIMNQQEYDAIKSLAVGAGLSTSSFLWVGIQSDEASVSTAKFYFSDETTANTTFIHVGRGSFPWRSGYPSGKSGFLCVMWVNDVLQDTYCDRTYSSGFVCRLPESPSPTTTPSKAPTGPTTTPTAAPIKTPTTSPTRSPLVLAQLGEPGTFGDDLYVLYSNELSQDAAQDVCLDSNLTGYPDGRLTSITSSSQFLFLRSFLPRTNYAHTVRFGIQRDSIQAEWESTDSREGVPYLYPSVWDYYEPSEEFLCAGSTSQSHLRLGDIDCNTGYAFICKFDGAGSPAPTISPTGPYSVPPAMFVGNSWVIDVEYGTYTVIGVPLTQPAAKAYCEQVVDGSKLATILGLDEFEHMGPRIHEILGAEEVWLGYESELYTFNPSDFKAIHGETAAFIESAAWNSYPWGSFYPGANGQCLTWQVGEGYILDEKCHFQRPFVCKEEYLSSSTGPGATKVFFFMVPTISMVIFCVCLYMWKRKAKRNDALFDGTITLHQDVITSSVALSPKPTSQPPRFQREPSDNDVTPYANPVQVDDGELLPTGTYLEKGE